MNPKFKVVTSSLNVRSGPGVGYNRIGSLSAGRVVEEVVISDWCPIAMGSGAIGWVSRKYLTPYDGVIEVPDHITGLELLHAAEEMIGKQDYVLGADSPLKQDDNYTGPTDCAEFVTERVQEVTGRIYGALRPESSNPEPWTGAWYADMETGKVDEIPVEQAIKTPGAILLRLDKQVQHIVFSDGKGGTVEAMGANYGVTRGQARGRKFQWGILIPGLIYRKL